jgi:hypothetical protein
MTLGDDTDGRSLAAGPSLAFSAKGAFEAVSVS